MNTNKPFKTNNPFEIPGHPIAKDITEFGDQLKDIFARVEAGFQQPKGCGKPTHVSGTNGGKMPCGAKLTAFGKTAPYFCADCQKKLDHTNSSEVAHSDFGLGLSGATL